MIDTAKIAEITGIRDLEEPEIRGQWATWDQHGSKGLMDERVKRLKDEGYVAFFSARDRRWGVKV